MSDNEFDVIGMVQSGAPVAFEITEIVIDDDGNEVTKAHKFALRQMTPTERDKLNYIETKLRDRIMTDYRAEGLDKQPVSDDLQAMIDAYLGAMEAEYQKALEDGNQEAAINAAREMENAPKNWPQNLAQQRANAAVKRADGRWAVENLLNGDRAAFNRLTNPEPLSHDAVKDALEKWQKLATFDPNSNGHRQSAPVS